MKTFLICLAILVAFCANAGAEDKIGDSRRFVYSGDGRIRLNSERTRLSFSGFYRHGEAGYDNGALKQICRVMGAPLPEAPMGLSLRFVEFMDYLQDHFNTEAGITITSGYRNPTYNQMLRDKGKLAAKASLHQYGMAADLKIEGVAAKALWEFVKSIKFGGTGYYGGSAVHVDVGPARFWDQNTSGVGTGISDDNKLICLVTDFDRYRAGETIDMQFIRMTAFPIGITPQFVLMADPQKSPSGSASFIPEFSGEISGPCPRFKDMAEMDGIKWKIPAATVPGTYRIKAEFCNNSFEAMPRTIQTPVFEITP